MTISDCKVIFTSALQTHTVSTGQSFISFDSNGNDVNDKTCHSFTFIFRFVTILLFIFAYQRNYFLIFYFKMTTCFLFFQISPVCVWYDPWGRQKRKKCVILFCWTNFLKNLWWWCNTNACDGNGWAVIITIYQRDFLPFRDSLIWQRVVVLLFCFFTGTIPIWWEVSGGYPPIQSPSRQSRLDGPRHLSLRLFFYFWP